MVMSLTRTTLRPVDVDDLLVQQVAADAQHVLVVVVGDQDARR